MGHLDNKSILNYNSKMNVYTYYDNINFPGQDRLVELWKISWQRRGFNPIVLNKTHAKKSPYYNDYVNSLKEIHKKVMGKEMKPYGLTCWLRWLAYSTFSEEIMMTCDYDVINGGVDIIEYEYKYGRDKINLLSNACPCLVIGSSSQFKELCKMFVEISLSNLANIQKHAKENKYRFYHDQEFFLANRPLLDGDKVRYFLDDKLARYENKDTTDRLVHISHYYTQQYIDNHPDKCIGKSFQEVRIYIMEVLADRG